MSKCLVTKLSGVVNNKNLTPIGCIGFTAYPSNNTLKLECTGDNVEFFTANGEAVFTTDKSTYVSRIAANQIVYVKTDKPTLIFISNKYELTKVDIYDSTEKSQIDFDFNDFLYCKKCKTIGFICYSKLTGDISSLSSLTNLQSLKIFKTSVTGDISSLSSLTNLQTLEINQTSVTGDISSLSSLTNLQTLNVEGTSVTGDISSLSSLTNLSNLRVGKIGTGYFKTLCNSLKTNGKTSGILKFWAYGGEVKIDSQTECPNNEVIATFSEGGVSYSGL